MGDTVLTIVTGPLNYVGVNPKIHCKVPEPEVIARQAWMFASRSRRTATSAGTITAAVSTKVAG